MREEKDTADRAEQVIKDFATAAASTSAAFAIGGLFGLDATYETQVYINMVQKLGELVGYQVETAEAISILQRARASEVGRVSSARSLLSWVPGVGSITNAATSFAYTQKLGRWIYLHLQNLVREKEASSLSEQHRILEDAATEIQNLLQQVEVADPGSTEFEMVTHVNGATTENFKRRIASAVKALGVSAFEELLDNPYTKVGKEIVEYWKRQY